MVFVVPAKAGTHTPRPIGENADVDIFKNNKRHGVWVPASAGTTAERTEKNNRWLSDRLDLARPQVWTATTRQTMRVMVFGKATDGRDNSARPTKEAFTTMGQFTEELVKVGNMVELGVA
jgi:hypothetical protein